VYLRLHVAKAFLKFCFFVHPFAGTPKEDEHGGELEHDAAEAAEPERDEAEPDAAETEALEPEPDPQELLGTGVTLPAPLKVAVGPAADPALEGGAGRQPSPRQGGGSLASGGTHGLAAVHALAS
jgi:hypothetical protein